MTGKRGSRAALMALACAVVMTTGCASRPHNPDDPLESYNRAMFAFNDGVDRAVVKPVAQAYETAVPQLVRTGMGNVFGNIRDVWTGVNNLLQGKLEEGMSDVMRVAMNSTFGIFGLFDIASEAGLEKHNEDFGQTLAVWGVGEGPFIVLPFFGPSTLRDTTALPLDSFAYGRTAIDHVPTRNTVTAVRLVHLRAGLLRAERAMGEPSDKYAFVRDAWLQNRRYRVHDGNPPVDDLYEDFDEEVSGPRHLFDADAVADAALTKLEFAEVAAVTNDHSAMIEGMRR